MLTETLIEWDDQWPLPGWLARDPRADERHKLTLRTASGAHTGVLLRARRKGLLVQLDWRRHEGPSLVQWKDVTWLALETPLRATGDADEAGTAANPWNAQIPRERLEFDVAFNAAHGQAPLRGHTLGYLRGRGGLFLFVEQADGSYRGLWLACDALASVRLGEHRWQARQPGEQATAGAGALPPVPTPWPAPAGDLPGLAQAQAQLRALPVPPLDQLLDSLHIGEPGRHESGLRPDELAARGVLTAEQAHRVLARMAAIPEADLQGFQWGDEADALGAADCLRYRACGLGTAGGIFYIACANPADHVLGQLLSTLLSRRVELVWAALPAIDARISLLLHASDNPPATGHGEPLPWDGAAAALPAAQSASPPAQDVQLEVLLQRAIVEARADPAGEHPSEVVESSDFVKLVRRIIQDALAMGASDIHIETNPGTTGTLIRLRRDGDLEPYLSLPATLRAPLISRIKVMARLDIAERRRPQDGKIQFADFGGSKLELRVAVLPTHDGLEDVVMRLLATSEPMPLSKLGLQPRDEQALLAMARRSFGLILAAGPTGSGKTTTLHSLLKELNTASRKIWTAEDPIEITQAGLRQLQVNPKIGVTFASAMRAFLRADPDVIMIGEIRDEETGKVAIEASLTGHLVLSTLHTNSAAESVTRLLEMGLDPMTFGDSLIGVVAQRLVRALCPRCAVSSPLAAAEFEALVTEYAHGSELPAHQARQRLLEAAGVSDAAAITTSHAAGCAHCGGKGYKGRIGVYEVLTGSPALRQLIHRHASPAELLQAAASDGMRTLRHDALEKVVQGRLDLTQARLAYE